MDKAKRILFEICDWLIKYWFKYQRHSWMNSIYEWTLSKMDKQLSFPQVLCLSSSKNLISIKINVFLTRRFAPRITDLSMANFLSNFPVHKLRVYFFPSRDLRPILWLEKWSSRAHFRKPISIWVSMSCAAANSVPEYEIRCNYILIYDVRRGRTTTTNNTAYCIVYQCP